MLLYKDHSYETLSMDDKDRSYETLSMDAIDRNRLFCPPLKEQQENFILERLKALKVKTVMELGCGDGLMLRQLLNTEQFTSIVGVDHSYCSLSNAETACKSATPISAVDLSLYQGSICKADARLACDALICIDKIQMIEPSKLDKFSSAVFESYAPQSVLISTPNADFYSSLLEIKYGKEDSKRVCNKFDFEWTSNAFIEWAQHCASKYGYDCMLSGVGVFDCYTNGYCNQIASFRKINILKNTAVIGISYHPICMLSFPLSLKGKAAQQNRLNSTKNTTSQLPIQSNPKAENPKYSRKTKSSNLSSSGFERDYAKPEFVPYADDDFFLPPSHKMLLNAYPLLLGIIEKQFSDIGTILDYCDQNGPWLTNRAIERALFFIEMDMKEHSNKLHEYLFRSELEQLAAQIELFKSKMSQNEVKDIRREFLPSKTAVLLDIISQPRGIPFHGVIVIKDLMTAHSIGKLIENYFFKTSGLKCETLVPNDTFKRLQILERFNSGETDIIIVSDFYQREIDFSSCSLIQYDFDQISIDATKKLVHFIVLKPATQFETNIIESMSNLGI
jgi:hypothetical protein